MRKKPFFFHAVLLQYTMSKIVQIKIFNDILDQLLGFLESNFPLFKSDLILTRSTVDFVRRSNPRLVVERFMHLIVPFKKEIFDCNEDFFLDLDNLSKSSSEAAENILTGMRIKNMWQSPSTTDPQKAMIWFFFHKLIKAGEKVIQ
jgi:hypothetical protein